MNGFRVNEQLLIRVHGIENVRVKGCIDKEFRGWSKNIKFIVRIKKIKKVYCILL